MIFKIETIRLQTSLWNLIPRYFETHCMNLLDQIMELYDRVQASGISERAREEGKEQEQEQKIKRSKNNKKKNKSKNNHKK